MGITLSSFDVEVFALIPCVHRGMKPLPTVEDEQSCGAAQQQATAERSRWLEAVQANGMALKDAPAELREDRAVVLAAVRASGQSLQFAAAGLQGDREIVLAAVQAFGGALSYAMPDLKNDLDIALAAVESWGGALKHAGPGPRADRAVVLAAVQRVGYAILYAAGSLQGDREMLTAAVRSDPHALLNAPTALRSEKPLVLEAVRRHGSALEGASPELQADREVVLEAVWQDPAALRFARGPLQKDREVLRAAGLLDESSGRPRAHCTATPRHVTMSVRFGFNRKATAVSTMIHQEMASHRAFKDRFYVYDPNLVSKGFCGPRARITDKEWPCVGDCRMVDTRLKCCRCLGSCAAGRGRSSSRPTPTKRSCWRYSFRWHQQRSARSGGFMVQVIESGYVGEMSKGSGQAKGAGQEIEFMMAQEEEGLKTFLLQVWFSDIPYLMRRSVTRCAEFLAEEVEAWLAGGGADTSLVEIRLTDSLEKEVRKVAAWRAVDVRAGSREAALAALCFDGSLLRYAAPSLREDAEAVLVAVEHCAGALRYASRELAQDREFVLAAVRRNGPALKHAADELRADREVALAACKQNISALSFAASELKTPEFLTEVGLFDEDEDTEGTPEL